MNISSPCDRKDMSSVVYFPDFIWTYSVKHTTHLTTNLKVHKIEIFFGFDFEICIISLLVM